jgi:hypothetical protein
MPAVSGDKSEGNLVLNVLGKADRAIKAIVTADAGFGSGMPSVWRRIDGNSQQYPENIPWHHLMCWLLW